MKILMMVLLAFSLSFVGCSGSETNEDGNVNSMVEGDGYVDSSNMDKMSSDMGNAMGLETVRFAFDSYALTSDSMSSLRNSAEILNQNDNVNIQIEGHCDERGSVQYNLALGDKRAKAVKRALQRLGVSPNRMETISFGKEQPLDPGSNEAAWAANRRANFVITSK